MQGTVEELFARFRRDGDAAAFGEVVERVGPELLQLALHLSGRPAEAEDLLQETLLTALERAEAWDERRPLAPWLVGILTNRARLARRRALRAPDAARLAELAAPPAPPAAASELELDRGVEAALLRVPKAYQPVLVLRLRHHLAVAEIANALRRPPGTVRSQLQRGLEHLRRLLPAGYAGALLALLDRPARGFAAVRAALLNQAGAAGAPSFALFLLMKHAFLAALLLAAAAGFTWFVAARPPAAPAGPTAGAGRTPAVASLAAPAAVDESAATEAAGARSVHRLAEAPPSAAAAPAAGGGTLLLRALQGETGLPAAGQLVMLSSFGELACSYYDPRAVHTDARGEARLDGLAAGAVTARLLLGGEGYAVIRPGETTVLELRARKGVTVSARVVDAAGRPVPGAELWVSEQYRSNLGYALAVADAEGRATLGSLADTQHVAARAPGYAPSLLHPVRGAEGSTLEVELVLDRDGGAVRGTARDARGAPVAEALVYLGPEQPERCERGGDGLVLRGPPLCRARSDAAGRFEAAGLELGELAVLARAQGHGPARARVSIAAGVTAELALVLPDEAVLVGRVTDAAGAPVGGADVSSLPLGALGGGHASTGSDGRFELRALAAGAAVEFEVAHKRVGKAAGQIALVAGETRTWNPVLATSAHIGGTVVDAHGAPLDGWLVVGVPDEGAAGWRSATTDRAGRFRLADVAPGAHRVLVQEPGDWDGLPRLAFSDVWPGAELVLAVEDPPANGALVAEVVRADGSPPAQGELAIWNSAEGWGHSFPLAAGGRLHLAWIPPGTVQLDLRVPGAPWVDLGQRSIEPGHTLDLGRIVLPDGGVLAGRLACPPAAQASLSFLLTDAAGRESGVVACARGEYRSSALAPGSYTLEVRGEAVAPAHFPFDVFVAEETRHDLELAPAPARDVVFTLPGVESTAPESLWCEVRDADGARVWMEGDVARRGESFATRISAPAGRYRVAAGTGSGLRAVGELVLAEGEEEPPLELALLHAAR